MVKCTECGFLAYRNLEDRSLVEAEKQFREAGFPPQPDHPVQGSISDGMTMSHGGGFGATPLCFANAANLPAEADTTEYDGEHPSISHNVQPTLKVITMERECTAFTAWQQGFTPKEHRDMLDRQRSIDREAQQRRSDRRWRLFELLAFILTGAIVAIFAALIQRGAIP